MFQKILSVENYPLACSKISLHRPLQTLMQHPSAKLHLITYTSTPSVCLCCARKSCQCCQKNCLFCETKSKYFLHDIFFISGNHWLSPCTLVSEFVSRRDKKGEITYDLCTANLFTYGQHSFSLVLLHLQMSVFTPFYQE